MVSLMLIVIGLFALIAMQTHAIRSQNDSRESHQASVLANSVLAEAEAALEADFSSDPGRDKSPLPDNPLYQAEVRITEIDPELKKIWVEVSWTEGPRAAHKILETVVARPY